MSACIEHRCGRNLAAAGRGMSTNPRRSHWPSSPALTNDTRTRDSEKDSEMTERRSEADPMADASDTGLHDSDAKPSRAREQAAAETAERPLIELLGVTKSYRMGRLDYPALRGIDLRRERRRIARGRWPIGEWQDDGPQRDHWNRPAVVWDRHRRRAADRHNE